MLFTHAATFIKSIPVYHPAISFMTPVLTLFFKNLRKFHRLKIVPHCNSHLPLLMC